jgi:N6-adenosine-specific RNA methylase IME4
MEQLITNHTDSVIAKLDIARQALVEADTIQKTKVIMDIAIAAEIYAKRQKLGEESIRYATAVKVEALRQLGNMLKETERATGGLPYQGSTSNKREPVERIPTLADLGLDKKTSSLAQRVADLSDEEMERVKKGITLASTIKEHRRQKIKEEAIKVDSPQGKYRIIYADPPWNYGDKRDGRTTGAEDHYLSMTINELCDLPIKEITENNAVLFLWVTSPLLEECFEVIEAWGFKYKTSFVWDKIKHNMGHYNSVRHEFLLVCTKGSCLPDNKKLFDSVLSIEKTEHSNKPEEFRNIIDTLYIYGNRIELFARQKVDGWDSWGNDARI